jgi:hypothetical protein
MSTRIDEIRARFVWRERESFLKYYIALPTWISGRTEDSENVVNQTHFCQVRHSNNSTPTIFFIRMKPTLTVNKSVRLLLQAINRPA